MAWQDEMTAILRAMVNDMDSTSYTDDRLEACLVVAGRFVVMDCDFLFTYAFDAANVTISPDPTVTGSRDENFINLACLKAACIIDSGSASKAAGQAIMVKDGSSQIDLRESFKAWLSLLEKGWCATYETTKEQYKINQASAYNGSAVLTPFRIFAGYHGETPFYSGRNRDNW